jgi:hypothetical protein
MASTIMVACPDCEKEFPVNPQLEHLSIKSQCPFCDHEFFLREAKKIVRSKEILLVK